MTGESEAGKILRVPPQLYSGSRQRLEEGTDQQIREGVLRLRLPAGVQRTPQKQPVLGRGFSVMQLFSVIPVSESDFPALLLLVTPVNY